MKSTSNEKTALTIATPDIALLKDEMETDVSKHIQLDKIRNFISLIFTKILLTNQLIFKKNHALHFIAKCFGLAPGRKCQLSRVRKCLKFFSCLLLKNDIKIGISIDTLHEIFPFFDEVSPFTTSVGSTEILPLSQKYCTVSRVMRNLSHVRSSDFEI